MQNNTPSTDSINVADLNNAVQQTLIHIELDKTFYSITPAELEILEEGSSPIWKDLTLAGLGIGIPCAVNALIENNKATQLNTEIFWNSLVAGIALILSMVFSIIWYKSKDKCKELILKVKQRPQYRM